MLKNIDPLLNAELLYVLRAMGHGDVIVVSDTNFPSDSTAQETVHEELLRVDAPAARVVKAILSVMPLDFAVEHPAMCMEVQDKPEEVPEVRTEVQQAIVDAGEKYKLLPIDRFKFYDMAKESYAVVTTAERRFWGCFMLKKGVLPPEEG
ncbi:MAG: ribose ABC transporter [Betaproteobacteria bacterium AqS2]|uniref:Ribose ABC transporter n=1 Tax=Candidatus Amphirhobacter heronislandensis TaxID=1732024 RepID=A0A930XW62_9GAMM|nr:ribose ABC transporter [Betaproteobacteria bacterium AqS2]